VLGDGRFGSGYSSTYRFSCYAAWRADRRPLYCCLPPGLLWGRRAVSARPDWLVVGWCWQTPSALASPLPIAVSARPDWLMVGWCWQIGRTWLLCTPPGRLGGCRSGYPSAHRSNCCAGPAVWRGGLASLACRHQLYGCLPACCGRAPLATVLALPARAG
jgi:hypothetical protein